MMNYFGSKSFAEKYSKGPPHFHPNIYKNFFAWKTEGYDES
jgi:hypothetical protein